MQWIPNLQRLAERSQCSNTAHQPPQHALTAGQSWAPTNCSFLGLMCGSQRFFSLGLCLGCCNPHPRRHHGFYSLFLCAAPTVPLPPPHCLCSKVTSFQPNSNMAAPKSVTFAHQTQGRVGCILRSAVLWSQLVLHQQHLLLSEL